MRKKYDVNVDVVLSDHKIKFTPGQASHFAELLNSRLRDGSFVYVVDDPWYRVAWMRIKAKLKKWGVI